MPRLQRVPGPRNWNTGLIFHSRAFLWGIALGVVVLAFSATYTTAQTLPCTDVETIRGKLKAECGERLMATGTSANQKTYVEFWVRDDGGTWTIVAIMPDGRACHVASGAGFYLVPVQDKGA